jgi:glycosyltransferase involved in cell wall biosynthesis
MVSGNCCICGTVRNCGPFLNKVIQNMETIGAIFDDYRIVISYDNSNDNSLEILKTYNYKKKDKVILHIGKEKLSNFRVYNIAKARNNCLDTIRSKFLNFEYFIMMDCDDVCESSVKLEPLLYYLNTNTEWDALTFNKKPYYDLWALSKYPYAFSCFHFKDWKPWGIFIEKIIKNTPPKTLIPCLSAFNGFAIYRTNKFINCFYDPTVRLDLLPKHLLEENEKICGPIYLNSKAGKIDCEHRSFHLMAIKADENIRIRIAPEIIF